MRSPVQRIALPPFAASLALVFMAGEPLAGTLNLRWNDCWGDGGVQNRVFACGTNLGSERLVASFISPDAVQGVTGFRASVTLGFGNEYPAWWDFMGATACRPASLTIGSSPPASAVSCVNWATSGPFYQFTYDLSDAYFGYGASLQVNAITGSQSNLDAAQEYFAFNIQINHARTVGTGSCSGCAGGACIAFVSLTLRLANAPQDVWLSGTHNDPAHVVTWQDGTGVVDSPPGYPTIVCFGVTEAKRSTWGAVKALYR